MSVHAKTSQIKGTMFNLLMVCEKDVPGSSGLDQYWASSSLSYVCL